VTRRPALIGLIAVILAWTWMFLTVHYNYGGNWTALYMIGPRTPVPPGIPAENLYIFPNNSGYDGQSFHVMAHDPWMRRSTPAEVEIEVFRYVRILVPALAWMLALGQDRWVDPAYLTVILAFVFLGVYWTALYAARMFAHPAWGLAFLLSPATLTSIDRMLVDVALATFCAAFVLYADRRRLVIVILAAALLTRETAWILFAAYQAFLLLRRRFADAVVAFVAALPLIAWHVYVGARAGQFADTPRVLGWMPFAGFFDRLAHPAVYDLAPSMAKLAIALDYVALCGMGLAVALSVALAIRVLNRKQPATAHMFAIFGFTLAVMFVRTQYQWIDAYGFGRIFAPLPLLIAMYYLSSQSPRRIWLGLAPTLLIDSRIALNLGKQALGILHGLFG
jgi:hypothetical protein